MGLLKSILNRLGIGKDEEQAEAPAADPLAAKPAARVPVDISRYVLKQTKDDGTEMSLVDVEAMLDDKVSDFGGELNWRMSIVDLLKLLEIDSSYEARKELAEELDCPPENMDDSARMNIWLHKEVMGKIAKNGGKVPDELLD